MKTFKDLIVWQKSVDLVIEVYEFSKQLPKHEQYGLISQMQRAAVSIPSNIAEGYKRNYSKEFIQFLAIANGSSGELETQLLIAKRCYSNLDCSRCESILLEVQKMLTRMILKNRQT
jgi:four helix bundle protein